LYVAIRAQPPEQRTILLLSLDGLGYREIAELTGLTENHVGVTLTRARQKLAEQLKEVRDEL
jgi:RNA polymerase sigma-70 factor (ECF subfamily)